MANDTLEPEALLIVGIDEIPFDPGDDLADPERLEGFALDEDMIASILAHGVVTPVTCRVVRHGKLSTRYWIVINGRRRVLHAREANRRLIKMKDKPIRVPYFLRDGTDLEPTIANEFAHDDDPLTKAAKLARLVARGYKIADLVGTMKGGIATLKNLHRLNRLAPEAKDALRKGEITLSRAYELARLPAGEQIDEPEAPDDTPDTEPPGPRKPRAKGGAMGKRQIKDWIEKLAPPLDEPADEHETTVRETLEWLLTGKAEFTAESLQDRKW